MKEDLRYIERLMEPVTTEEERHVKSAALEALRRQRLLPKEKERVLSHLLQCEDCMQRYVSLETRSKRPYLRNVSLKALAGAALALAASLLFLFVVPLGKESDLSLGKYSFAQVWMDSGYKAAPVNVPASEQIDMDAALQNIVKRTSMDGVPYYAKAMRLAAQGAFEQARIYYKKAQIAIRHTKDTKLRMQQQIVLNYRLMQLAHQEAREVREGIEEYKKLLRYDIAIYLLKYKEER